MTPQTLILRSAGTNCDVELAHAFHLAGSDTQSIHLNALIEHPERLAEFDILGFPGGFSFGDDIAAGRILANRLKHRLYPALRDFVAAGKPVIGICNGFQVLVKLGLLPDFDPQRDIQPPTQTATLADNALPRFTDRWVSLRAEPQSVCIWTKGLDELQLCIAHGEGRFLADDTVLDQLETNRQIALRYTDNPNGSMRDIAGVCDKSGLVFGLMPHPERLNHPTNHINWTRNAPASRGVPAPAPQLPGALGLTFFRNAVEYAQKAHHSPVS
ncbi:MAG: phosphoribosylformylglycinamidine synthase I [Phycisphaeraceae bacterium]